MHVTALDWQRVLMTRQYSRSDSYMPTQLNWTSSSVDERDVVKVPVEDITFSLLLYHFVLDKELQEVDDDVAGTLEPYTGIADTETSEKGCIENRNGDCVESHLKRPAMQFLCHDLVIENSSFAPWFRIEPFDDLGQSFLIDLEGKWREVAVSDKRRVDLAYLSVGFVPGDLEDGFRLVVEFRPDVTTDIVIGFVQV